jgi:hypothetical protein
VALGTVRLQAIYSGDADNLSSTSSFSLPVK